MGKQPGFYLYINDLLRDTRCLSLAAKGAWSDLLMMMWDSPTRGELSLPIVGYARLFGATVDQTEVVIKEIKDMRVGDVEMDSNGIVIIRNRRMYREQKERESTRSRVQRFRNTREKRKSNDDVTPPSSISFTNSKEKEPSPPPENGVAFSLFWSVYPKKSKKRPAFKEWKKAKEKPPIEDLIKILNSQIKNKEQLKKAGLFCPEWPDPERWIKDARWQDELNWPTIGKPKEQATGPAARIKQGDDILEMQNGQWVKVEKEACDV